MNIEVPTFAREEIEAWIQLPEQENLMRLELNFINFQYYFEEE